ncbi:hypothetical protein ASE00_00050 [Sphingomonas sp. Root710]|uniref:hypothetical protein n=1 Tax=Sphingomonas sp. Root710 TaxID=1736594 RepID=UPI0006FC4307|nr:hypothetical protein [Sphingomonas sp. Root710]KRB85247.1 hypothetical protein ASE00_00050 [Sphingomonas sp. Root710]
MIGRIISCATAALLALSPNARANGASAPAAPSPFQAKIVPLFESKCAICHMTGEEAGGMSLVADNIVSSVVGVAAAGAPGQIRVVPGTPDKSYLLMKLEGTHLQHGGEGAQMPFGSPPLSAGEIAAIRQWIADGAKP